MPVKIRRDYLLSPRFDVADDREAGIHRGLRLWGKDEPVDGDSVATAASVDEAYSWWTSLRGTTFERGDAPGPNDDQMKVYDISRGLTPSMAVWPGDQPFERDWTSSIEQGDPANVGRMRLSLHAGTHADAPFHFRPNAATIDQLDLSIFVGPAIVIDAGDAASIGADAIAGVPDLPPRVLFRTLQSNRADDHFDPQFPHVEPDLAPILAEKRVVLIGTDSPSVDPFDGEGMTSHHALAENGIHILENLQLTRINPGRYLLVAAPLKLTGMDGSPVRALLIDGSLF